MTFGLELNSLAHKKKILELVTKYMSLLYFPDNTVNTNDLKQTLFNKAIISGRPEIEGGHLFSINSAVFL